MLSKISQANLGDAKRELSRMLQEASQQLEVREYALAITPGYDEDQISAVFKNVRSNIQYQPDPKGSELFIAPRRMIEMIESDTAAGDCVTGDTPIWIKRKGITEIVEVRELLPVGQYGQFLGMDILTPDGFAPLISIRRKGIRQTVRLLTTSDIGITPSHKLLINPPLHTSRYRQASQVDLDEIVRVHPDLEFSKNGEKPDIEYEIGWAYGLFFADGSSSIRQISSFGGESWRIVNRNSQYLERAAFTFEKLYPKITFPIKLYDSYTKGTSVNSPIFSGRRVNNLYSLDALLRYRSAIGIRARFVVSFRRQIYNSLGIKKVPTFILNGSEAMAKGFWDGAHAGDGEQDGHRISSHHKLGTLGLASILHRLGRTSYVASDHDAVRIHATKNYGNHKPRAWRIDGPDQEVFDIATKTGEFVAADIAVKNCDDISLFCASLYRSLGYESRIVLLNIGGETFDHAVCEVKSDKLKEWVMIDATRTDPPGWVPRYHARLEVN